MEVVDGRVTSYMQELASGRDEPVLLEMEREAEASGFPIVGRLVGVTIELLARSISARRVFELGSGFGYSAYWFSRATGEGGELHLTDRDPENERKALEYLGRAGLSSGVEFHTGDALEELDRSEGEFDIVFSDVDKVEYPRIWEHARERIRRGGLYICDNVIQGGKANVVTGEDAPEGVIVPAILEHNSAVASDPRYVSTLIPIRDGVMVALRLP